MLAIYIERKLAEHIRKNSKSFFVYVGGRSCSTKKEGLLVNCMGDIVDSSEGMSELFNEAFGKVFTKEGLNNITEDNGEFEELGVIGICDIIFTEDLMSSKFDRLRNDKAAGADELVPRFLIQSGKNWFDH